MLRGGGGLSNSPPPPLRWGCSSSGSLGFPKVCAGGSRTSPPPPAGDGHIAGLALHRSRAPLVRRMFRGDMPNKHATSAVVRVWARRCPDGLGPRGTAAGGEAHGPGPALRLSCPQYSKLMGPSFFSNLPIIDCHYGTMDDEDGPQYVPLLCLVAPSSGRLGVVAGPLSSPSAAAAAGAGGHAAVGTAARRAGPHHVWPHLGGGAPRCSP